MGDLRTGELGSSPLSLLFEVADGATECADTDPLDVEGRPEISSWTSVTTSPLAVILLLRMMRLCGNNPREV